jgi:hypothetical protein
MTDMGVKTSYKDMTDRRTYPLAIGSNWYILWIFSKICSNMFEYSLTIKHDGRMDSRSNALTTLHLFQSKLKLGRQCPLQNIRKRFLQLTFYRDVSHLNRDTHPFLKEDNHVNPERNWTKASILILKIMMHRRNPSPRDNSWYMEQREAMLILDPDVASMWAWSGERGAGKKRAGSRDCRKKSRNR